MFRRASAYMMFDSHYPSITSRHGCSRIVRMATTPWTESLAHYVHISCCTWKHPHWSKRASKACSETGNKIWLKRPTLDWCLHGRKLSACSLGLQWFNKFICKQNVAKDSQVYAHEMRTQRRFLRSPSNTPTCFSPSLWVGISPYAAGVPLFYTVASSGYCT